jgi:spermidine synthase
MTHAIPAPARRHYLAVFLLSLAVMMLEITVARILSVVLFSHYAFVAISLAMFGLGLSGLIVYLFPAGFPADALDRQVLVLTALFGLSAAVSILIFMRIHIVQEVSLEGFLTLGAAYVVLAVPFFLGGLCISLLMTHFSSHVARIYYADLTGASLGCLGVVAALQLASAPHVVLFIAAVVAAAALLFARSSTADAGWIPAAAFAIVAVLLIVGCATPLGTLAYVKRWTTRYSDHEEWNAFSRVSAFHVDQNAAEIVPLKYSSTEYKTGMYPASMMIDIDGAAWTPMMNFNGDVETIQFLRGSVLYAAHHLKPNADVLVIGTGGGRDLLAGLAFRQHSILGIEINPLMKRTVNEWYGDYSGRPYTHPGVDVIIDEARSRLSSLDRRFDVIQLSLIDTFSLNATGGFVFSENYLYTAEAFEEYFDHLTPDGILTLTRYFVPRYPLEMLRLTAMTRAAWEAKGVERFADQVIVLQQGLNATMLAKRSPFSAEELRTLTALTAENNMGVLYRPGMTAPAHGDLSALITTPDWRSYVAAHEFVIDPPTDNSPFFFNFLRGLVTVPAAAADPFFFLKLWNDALVLMYMLIGVVTTIAVLFFVVPLCVFGPARTAPLETSIVAPLLLYFACLGYGFLMIEIPLLQRFVLLLGYPVYALVVVLFALLLFSGLGSLLSARYTDRPKPALMTALLLIIAIAVSYVALLPVIITALLGTPIVLRIAVTVALLAPVGLGLGMAYPLGIAVLRRYDEALVPWAWGLNGALSVVASVLATFIGSKIGFSAALLTGVAAYGIGLLSMAIATNALGSDTIVEAPSAPQPLGAGQRI